MTMIEAIPADEYDVQFNDLTVSVCGIHQQFCRDLELHGSHPHTWGRENPHTRVKLEYAPPANSLFHDITRKGFTDARAAGIPYDPGHAIPPHWVGDLVVGSLSITAPDGEPVLEFPEMAITDLGVRHCGLCDDAATYEVVLYSCTGDPNALDHVTEPPDGKIEGHWGFDETVAGDIFPDTVATDGAEDDDEDDSGPVLDGFGD